MTEKQIHELLAKLKSHLLVNNFSACHEILDGVEKFCGATKDRDELEAICNLDLDPRWKSLLERMGYIYLDELEEADIDSWEVRQLGDKGKKAIKKAIAKARKEIKCLQ